MSTPRPASLDGSLLARKGDASPAIANDSPLLEELGEPRPDKRGSRSAGDPAARTQSGALAAIRHKLAWLAEQPVFGVAGLAIGIAILFAVTIAALTPSPEVPAVSASSPMPPASAASAVAPEKIILPTDDNPITEPSTAASETAPPASAAVANPDPPPAVAAPVDPPVKTAPPEPPKKAAAKPPSLPVAAAKPSGRSGNYLLQLSAVGTARAARQELVRLEKRLGNILGDRRIIVVKAVPPGKPPVYRLRASAYESRAAARVACKRVRTRKLACIVVRR